MLASMLLLGALTLAGCSADSGQQLQNAASQPESVQADISAVADETGGSETAAANAADADSPSQEQDAADMRLLQTL